MIAWHHWLNGHGFGSTPGVGDGQGGPVCCSSWGLKESNTTEWLKWTKLHSWIWRVFLVAQTVKKSSCNGGDPGSIPQSRWAPGEWNGNPLQYSCLKNPMDKRAWQAAVHRVAESWTLLKRLRALIQTSCRDFSLFQIYLKSHCINGTFYTEIF